MNTGKRLRFIGIATFLAIAILTTSVLAANTVKYNGNANGGDVMLQAFTWTSVDTNKNGWYQLVGAQMGTIAQYFTVVWLPPPAQPYERPQNQDGRQGYLPQNWYNLNNNYGSQANLKSLISSLHSSGIKVLADMVLNHRVGMTTCPHGKLIEFPYKAGINPNELNMATDLISGHNDIIDYNQPTNTTTMSCPMCAVSNALEGTWSWSGRSYSNNDFNLGADLDHYSTHTQQAVIAWEKWLENATDAGFDGWRYDYIGGYDPKFLGTYNDATTPYLSVGEFWESFPNELADRQALADVVDESASKTMVFDYALKTSLNSAFNVHQFNGAALGDVNGDVHGLIGWWGDAAVTFVDNHDTGYSVGPTNGQHIWPLPTPDFPDITSVKAAYAFILTHPGIPCVYWYDWQQRDNDLQAVINAAIAIRKANGVHRGSLVRVVQAQSGVYAAYIGDTPNAEQVAIKIGNQGQAVYENWVPSSSLGLNKTLTRYDNGGTAFCIYYKN